MMALTDTRVWDTRRMRRFGGIMFVMQAVCGLTFAVCRVCVLVVVGAVLALLLVPALVGVAAGPLEQSSIGRLGQVPVMSEVSVPSASVPSASVSGASVSGASVSGASVSGASASGASAGPSVPALEQALAFPATIADRFRQLGTFLDAG